MSINTFFITGSQRSGTTLLADILGRHPDIHMGEDTVGFRLVSCFTLYQEVLPYNLEHSWAELQKWLIEEDYKGRVSGILDLEDIDKYYNAREFVQHGIGKFLKKEGKSVFGDKTPNMEIFINSALAIMPYTKFVHIVRDGRATASSISKRSYKNIRLAAYEWVRGNAAGLYNQSIVGSNQYMIVKYEDLLRFPKETLLKICSFIEVEFDEKLLQSDHIDDSKSYVKAELDQSKIDSFKTELSNRKIRIIEKIQGAMLEKFDYDLISLNKAVGYKQFSIISLIWYRQLDNVKQLFLTKRKGMRSRNVIEVRVPFKVRLKTFVLSLCRDFLPEIMYRRIIQSKKVRKKSFPQSKA